MVSVEDADRHLFVILPDGGQVARYTDGEWWLEYPTANMIPGHHIKVDQAVRYAMREGAEVIPDQIGGGVFYKRLAARQEE